MTHHVCCSFAGRPDVQVPLDARELQELPEQASETAKSKQCAAKNFRCGECADDFSFCKECKTITPGDATVSPPVPSVTWTATVRPDINEEAVTCSPNGKRRCENR
jgi:hypothetical protein